MNNNLYPKNIEEKLGFDTVRELLAEKCEGPVGESYVYKMRFSDRFDLIQKLVAQTDEFVQLLVSGDDFPRSNYLDMEDSLKKSKIIGAYLLEEELYDLKRALTTLHACLAFFYSEKSEEYVELKKLTETVNFDAGILKKMEAIIDDRGKIKDNASPELSRIRSKLASEEGRLRKVLDASLRNLKQLGMAAENSSPTIREGRMVVPVPAEYKRKVKGIVHDSSATGQTVYIEPEEVLNLNNEIRELGFLERQEIIKILSQITDEIRPMVDDLLKANLFLGMIDFIKAKASLAIELDAIKPEAVPEPYIEWYEAYHPLLLLNFRKMDRKVVPQNVKLNEEQRIVLVSGPNAGGKSVALKTIGLIQYMYQCGMMVTILETSKMGVFKKIFIDIGDEQSLEDDLSTYSSHLTNMKHFLLNARHSALCLIDEFGAGTEPKLGGAIAEAILERLNQQTVFGIITTHYANLKVFADKTEGLINGAMRYDVENLQPLYKLDLGKPGSSFALEISEKIGLPKKVVAAARKKVGSKQVSLERLLSQLETDKHEVEEKQRELVRKERELEKLKEKYELLKEFQETNKKKLISNAKVEAEKLLKEANQKIEQTIKGIRENKADREVTKSLRKDLEEFKEKVEVKKKDIPQEEIEPKEEIVVVGGQIKAGDYVQIKGQTALGEVLAVGSKDAEVSIGLLRSNIKLNRLTKVSRKNFKKQQKAAVNYSSGIDLNAKMANFKPKIDLRGKRAEEALKIVDDFVDEAVILGQKTLTIVHGKGDGILRQLIRNQLKNFKEVKSMEDEHPDHGGPGVTLVTLQ
ncbi:Smr/MutS family protein [Flammeovirgaceae bacterium SG7u.111]|nr:Smr/MutS family protein [Flammeovirgaceae bacterium SG7u.132]WPO33404.1 Smr/MutS family protein [Flammeovirgaceae bacterium SG7u.111]